MHQSSHPESSQTDPSPNTDFRGKLYGILRWAMLAVPEGDFLRRASRLLIEFSECASVAIQVQKGETVLLAEVQRDEAGQLRSEARTVSIRDGADSKRNRIMDGLKAHVTIPLIVTGETLGQVRFSGRQHQDFSNEQIAAFTEAAECLSTAIVNRRAHAALGERIKELTCLYGIAQLDERPSVSVEDVLQGIVALLPPAWQYPDMTLARITLDGCTYATPGYKTGQQSQAATIIVGGEQRGAVEVTYTERMPNLDEGPFLKEERHLIDAVGRQAAFIVERREAEEETLRLREQLMHADRLATIGQLAAGVAHELNEPLANILGFAQLAQKGGNLSEQVGSDLAKIEKAALHARDIIKKLLVFARQAPATQQRVDLNQVIEEGLSFLEVRCIKAGIALKSSLAPDLPEILGDPALLHQALVNIVVNGVQAMPKGGQLAVSTHVSGNQILLSVKDSGIGMSEEVSKQIFLPFFTTKDIGEGTGLGLAVVHGIVASHGGSIKVKSEIGHGTRFEVFLPVPAPEQAQGSA